MEQEDIVITFEDFDGTVLEIKNIPIDNVQKKPRYLNADLVGELREAINSSPIFWKDDKYHSFYNQVCAAMDRLGTAVDSSINIDTIPKAKRNSYVLWLSRA